MAPPKPLPPLELTHPDGRMKTRGEMESYLRAHPDFRTAHAWRRVASDSMYQWPIQKAYGIKQIFVLHWLLDEMIRRGQIHGDVLGVVAETPDSPQLLQEFSHKLAVAIQTGQATPPKDGEGIDMNNLPPPPPAPPTNGQTLYPPPPPAIAPPLGATPPQGYGPPSMQGGQLPSPPQPNQPQQLNPQQLNPQQPPQAPPPQAATTPVRRGRGKAVDSQQSAPVPPPPGVAPPPPPQTQQMGGQVSQMPLPPNYSSPAQQFAPPPALTPPAPLQAYASPTPQPQQGNDLQEMFGQLLQNQQNILGMLQDLGAKVQDQRAQVNDMDCRIQMLDTAAATEFCKAYTNDWPKTPEQLTLEGLFAQYKFPIPPR